MSVQPGETHFGMQRTSFDMEVDDNSEMAS